MAIFTAAVIESKSIHTHTRPLPLSGRMKGVNFHYSSNTMAGRVCSAIYTKAYIKYYKTKATILSCLSACLLVVLC